jgi:diguanylate cyclase (GGDEF)-like protein
LQNLIFFLLLIWIPSAASFQSIDVGDLNEGYSLNDHVEYIVDDLGEYQAEQLMSPGQQWLKHDQETLSFGYTRSTYWFRFEVHNSTHHAIHHLLEIAYPVLDNISMYVYDAKNGLQVAQHTLGDKIPFNSRQIQHRNFVVPLDLEPAQKQVWLLRIKTSSAMQVPIKIWRDRQFFIGDQARIMGLGLYYGIMFIMVLYNVFVFMSVREENYLYYVLYVASMAVFLASLQGLTFQYIWPNATSWNDRVIIVMLAGVVVFAGLFTRNFLFLSKGEEKLNLAAWLVIISSTVIALSVNFISYAILIQALIGIAVVGISLAIYAGILRWGQGYSSARYYTIAWSSVLLGGITLALNKFNIIPRNFFTENAIQLGSLLEVILLSFALAERLNHEKRERFEAQITALNHERIANAAQAEALEQERFARVSHEKALVHEREAREAQARVLAIQSDANETLEHKVRERTNELQSVNEKLAELSTTDALTGVRNRRYFDQMLEREFNRARREREQLSILMLDIDYFKQVNDEYGHQVGDDALRRVANILGEVLHRTTDFIARYGGEEFAIILPNTDVAGAYNVAEKIRNKIAKQQFNAAGITFSITVSIGLMGDAPSSGFSADFWLKEADDALYKAKEEGRNKVVLSTCCPKNSHSK